MSADCSHLDSVNTLNCSTNRQLQVLAAYMMASRPEQQPTNRNDAGMNLTTPTMTQFIFATCAFNEGQECTAAMTVVNC